jgi:hypothetical protein
MKSRPAVAAVKTSIKWLTGIIVINFCKAADIRCLKIKSVAKAMTVSLDSCLDNIDVEGSCSF